MRTGSLTRRPSSSRRWKASALDVVVRSGGRGRRAATSCSSMSLPAVAEAGATGGGGWAPPPLLAIMGSESAFCSVKRGCVCVGVGMVRGKCACGEERSRGDGCRFQVDLTLGRSIRAPARQRVCATTVLSFTPWRRPTTRRRCATFCFRTHRPTTRAPTGSPSLAPSSARLRRRPRLNPRLWRHSTNLVCPTSSPRRRARHPSPSLCHTRQ